jgi:predicted Zn finger-like uncharacterized protein
MQFVCDRCKAKYDIDESRLRGKAVKIRCRTCGNILEVRDPNLPPGSKPSLPPPPTPATRGHERVATPLAGRPVPPAAAPAARPVVTPGPLGEKFQKVFEGHGRTPAAMPAPAAAMLAAAGAGPAPQPARAPVQAPHAGVPDDEATHIIATPFLGEAAKTLAQEEIARKLARWHVAIRNQPMGPMSEEAIRRHIENGEVTLNSLVWREGFDEWRPLGQVRDLAYLAEAAAKKAGGASGVATWRESIFELPAGTRGAGGVTSLAPPAPTLNRYLVNGIVAVIAFALGMVFMYLVSSGEASAPPTDEPVGGGVPVVEEVTTSGELPTLRSGSLTIQLTNPTIVAEEALNPPAGNGTAAATGTAGTSNGTRTTGGRSGTPRSTGTSGTSPAPVVPGQNLGPAGGQIRGGTPTTGMTVGGSQPRPLTAQQILPVVSAGQSGIQHCYDQARVRDYVLDLSVRLVVEIAPDGSVRNTSMTSDDYITGDLESCILGRVRSWQFPRASATSRVVLPFAFHQR